MGSGRPFFFVVVNLLLAARAEQACGSGASYHKALRKRPVSTTLLFGQMHARCHKIFGKKSRQKPMMWPKR
jgi:hypothetical protein